MDPNIPCYILAYGGGISCENSTIVDCLLIQNQANVGAAIYAVGTSTVLHCYIANNVLSKDTTPQWPQNADGAINCSTGTVLDGNVVVANTGCGIYVDGGGIARDCLIACNSNGAIIVTGGGTVENCTVVGNSSSGSVGGIDLESPQAGPLSFLLQNNIVCNNSSNQVSDGVSNAMIRFNCIEGWTNPVDGNIANDPQFVDASGRDYHLSSNSPCIDVGTNLQWMLDGADLDGNPRIVRPRVDMGAYEYPYTESGVAGAWLRQYSLPTDGSADLLDTDSDGMDNRGEYESDTIPTNAESVLRFLSIGSQWGGARLDWKGGRGAWQFLEVNDDLCATNWSPIYALPPPTPFTNALIDFGATNRTLFYRIRAER